MSPALAIWLLVFIISFIMRVPVAFCMIISSILYFLIEGISLGVVMETMVLGFEDKFVLLPSIPMIIYAMLSGASVGNLFLGGIIPGLLMGIAMIGTIYFLAKKKNYPQGQKADMNAFITAFKKAFLSLMTPVILLGGIYGGIFTPTEAAAAAAGYALFLVIVVYRQFGFSELVNVIRDTVESTGFLSLIIAGAFIFGYVIAREQIPALMAEFLLGITTNKWMILLLNMMIGLATPPFGMFLFIVSELTDTPLLSVIKEIVPFLITLIGVLLLCTYVPAIVLFLPRMFGY